MDRFYDEIRKNYKALTAQQVDVLVLAGDMDGVIKNSLPMMVNVAKSFSLNYDHPIEDFISVGNEALVTAFNTYDVNNDAHFGTYAKTVITHLMIAFIRTGLYTIRIPTKQLGKERLPPLSQVDIDLTWLEDESTEIKPQITVEQLTNQLLKIIPLSKVELLYDRYGIGREKLSIEEMIPIHGGKGKSRQNVQEKVMRVLAKLKEHKEVITILKQYI